MAGDKSANSAVRVVVLDIEGTVCRISFVKDVLFPYAASHLKPTLDSAWDSPQFAVYRNAFPSDCISSKSTFEAHARDLMERDVKASYLKALQGYLWEEGYKRGLLKAPLFPDVAKNMSLWSKAGLKLMIYSSGSVPAQKLLFGHIDDDTSDLTPLITDWFDTTNAGPKNESSSYSKIIATHPEFDASGWLFLSDNLAEVEAAISAGMQAIPVSRPGNPPLPLDHQLASSAIQSFDSLDFGR